MNPTKPPRCRTCKAPATIRLPLAWVCTYTCAEMLAMANRAKARLKVERLARKALQEGRIAQKSRSDHLRDAQVAFNKFIRLRDVLEPCISCGTMSQTIQYAAGHYRTVGANPELRFSEENVHKQCNKKCNLELSGNILNYRLGLIRKIGVGRLELLEGKHEPKKYTVDQIKAITNDYRAKLKASA